QIDDAQGDALGIFAANDPRTIRADDIEETDGAHGDAGKALADAMFLQIGRQMDGDESELETADEEAGGEQIIGTVAEGAHDRFSGGTRRPKAAMTMPKEEAAMPMPTSTPPPK